MYPTIAASRTMQHTTGTTKYRRVFFFMARLSLSGRAARRRREG
jgi:hypothetical protein